MIARKNIPFALLLGCLLLMVSANGLWAQAWAPLGRWETHHFHADTTHSYPDRSIRVDSVTATAGDSVWHLTRYLQVLPGDTAIRNWAGFLQRQLRQHVGGWWQFADPGNIAVHTTAGLGATWLLDSLQGIQGTVSRLAATNVLGVPDSLKVIALSTGDSLVLSRDHGIVEWPASLDGHRFTLAGLQAQGLGDTLPALDQWFAYQPGQGFSWQGYWIVAGGFVENYYFEQRLLIDSVRYDASGARAYFHGRRQLAFSMIGPGVTWYPVQNFGGMLEMQRIPGGVSSLLHRTGITSTQTFDLYSFLGMDYMDLMMPMEPSGAGSWGTLHDVRLTGTSGTRILDLGMYNNGTGAGSYAVANGDTFRGTYTDNLWMRFEEGKGLTKVAVSGFEWLGERHLMDMLAAGDDTTGFLDTGWVVTAVADAQALDVRLGPNPTAGALRVTLPGAAEAAATLYDLRGVVRWRDRLQSGDNLLDLSSLPSGVYVLQVTAADGRTAKLRILRI